MSAFTRRRFLQITGVGVLGAIGLPSIATGAPGISNGNGRPNMLFIMADDHAANAISSYGGRLAPVAPTQNIDRLAAEGTQLVNCFCTNSICVPSRASILTGQYSHCNGVYTLRHALDSNQETVAHHLQQAGYKTAMIGKWHLRSQPSGFDYWFVLPGQGQYYDPVFHRIGHGYDKTYRNPSGRQVTIDKNARTFQRRGYVTDVITDETLNWLDNRNKKQPFFLMCHFKAPHGLWEYPVRYTELFKDVTIPEPPSLWEDKSHRSPGSREYGATIRRLADRMSSKDWPTGQLHLDGLSEIQIIHAAYQKYVKEYLRCVRAVDENVGRLLDYLDNKDLAENTVVIYTTDQGMFLGEHGYYDKRWMYEESMRMPFLVRYPEEIPAGKKMEELVANVDFAPTFLDYAGASIPSSMQGRSFRQLLNDTAAGEWRNAVYYRYWQHGLRPAHYGLRTSRYKLIFFYGLNLGMSNGEPTNVGWELYDLEQDPEELHNRYPDPDYAMVVADLKSRLDRLKSDLGDTDDKYPEMRKIREAYW